MDRYMTLDELASSPAVGVMVLPVAGTVDGKIWSTLSPSLQCPPMTIPPAADAAAESKPILLPPPAPLDGFSVDEFKARRRALRQALPTG